jgi:hypothetical protein
MENHGPEKEGLLQDRKDVVLTFITLLASLAFAEMVPSVRDSVRKVGVTFPSVALFVVFFLTSTRFYVGAVLHLISLASGWLWFFDFMQNISTPPLYDFC